MRYGDYKFVDTATNGVGRRNSIRLATDKLTGTDVYKTYFRYPQAFVDHFNKQKPKSVKGYNGFAYADFFPIDIDAKDNLPKALELFQRVLETLEAKHNVNLNEIRMYFSGSKGFHIHIPAEMIGIEPKQNIAQYFKRFASELLTPMGIEYDSSIYDIVRLWRVGNTINSKSGLYKIPLTLQEAFSGIDEIIELAKQPRTIEYITDCMENDDLAAIYRSIREMPVVNGEPIKAGASTKFKKLCYQKMLEGVGDGNRDNVAFRLATHFMKEGFASDMTEAMMQAWNRKNRPPLSEREISDKVKSAYSGAADYGCNDEIVRSFCSPFCYFKTKEQREEPTTNDLYTAEQLNDSYRKYVAESKLARIVLPIPVIGPPMRGISPGEGLYILARAGVGKTAGLINILHWITRANKEPMMFFSMEQPAPQVFERMAQISNGIGGIELERIMSSNAPQAKYIERKTVTDFEHVLVCERSGLSVNDIATLIQQAEKEKVGKKIRLVALDYMGLLTGNGKDQYSQVTNQAKDLQKMFKETKTAGIVLTQINRAGGDGHERVTMDMARDSGAIEEVATFIIGLWKIKDTDQIRAELLKNKHGASGVSIDFDFQKPSLRFENPAESVWNDKITMVEQFGQEVSL